MSNSDWIGLSDAEKGQLVSMWIVAADKGGSLPDDPNMIRKMCILDGTPDINKFKMLGFIDAKRTPRRRPVDAPETETETEKKKPCAPKNDALSDFNLFWDAFNDKRGKDGALKSWVKIKANDYLVEQIVVGATKYSALRSAMKASGQTPKMAQGWLTDKRWEDEYKLEETIDIYSNPIFQ
jgi:hypothetical protein